MTGRRPTDNEVAGAPLLARVLETRRQARDRLRQLESAGHNVDWWAEEITVDHPMAKVMGHDQAIAFAETLARRAVGRCPSGLTRAARRSQASRRRVEVRSMSEAGRSVAEIAEALHLSYGYVVQLRTQLGVGRKR